MKIHPLWTICVLVRISLIFFIYYLYHKKKQFRKYILFLLLLIGCGFLYKSITGSNNEKQIAKVFWHKTRIIHSLFYLLSAFYIFKKKINISSIILIIDIIFSILYRFTFINS